MQFRKTRSNSMSQPPDAILDRVRVREVTGIFHSRDGLNGAVADLLPAGFDRADIDVVASLDEVTKRLGIYVAADALADVPAVPRRPFFGPEDVTLVVATVAAIFAAAGAMFAAFGVVSNGGSYRYVVFASVVAGLLCGILGAAITVRFVRKDERKGLDQLMADRGLVLWVRTRSAEREVQAKESLLAHGARAVRVHELEVEKTVEDLPLHALRPDPWLGSEPLGHP
jgi:hypothetical protein